MKWTLIAGGARKLGAEIARTLAVQKRNIVIHYNTSEKEAHALVAELKKQHVHAAAIQGDFSSPQGVEQFLESYLKQFKETDGLVYNIGNYLLGAATETSSSAFSALFQTNLFAPHRLIQALPTLKQIVAIGMVGCSEVRANVHACGYNMTKTALYMLVKSLAKELAPSKVCVNMVSPGYMEESIDLPTDPEKIPLGRLATPQEVARVVAFLLDPASSYITGQNIEVAGGARL